MEATVLIADDDQGHTNLIYRNLRRAGLHNPIHTFTNGQELIDFLFQQGCGPALDTEKPYLLLLDLRMPVVDGREVLRRIKAHELLRNMPVIMFSSTEDPASIRECYALGCSNFISKPLSYASFVDSIKRLGMFIKIVNVPPLHHEGPLHAESER